MVNVNLFDNETGSFWRGHGMDPPRSKRKSSCCPARVFHRKGRQHRQLERLQQWRYKAVNPVGDSLPDGDIMSEIFLQSEGALREKGRAAEEAITELTWPYGKMVGKHFRYDPRMVAAEINGFFLVDKKVEKSHQEG